MPFLSCTCRKQTTRVISSRNYHFASGNCFPISLPFDQLPFVCKYTLGSLVLPSCPFPIFPIFACFLSLAYTECTCTRWKLTIKIVVIRSLSRFFLFPYPSWALPVPLSLLGSSCSLIPPGLFLVPLSLLGSPGFLVLPVLAHSAHSLSLSENDLQEQFEVRLSWLFRWLRLYLSCGPVPGLVG